ncbi:MAG: hypothetical protein HY901_14200 [Deltaproteobacteria bacterium]|nr:hypothetical protein [Deltaproteobacteria bacterium]
MRRMMIGIAAAALLSSGVAQARPGDRPNDYGTGGGRPGSVVGATNPYRGVEAGGLARGMQNALRRTNFHASRPADSSGAKDLASMNLKATSRSGGHGTAGAVRNSLNVYRSTEIMGMARGQERALRKTNQGASRPADPSGAKDRASMQMKTMSSMRGGGMAGSVKAALNTYRTAEKMGIARGMQLALRKTNMGASMPADPGGTASDPASKQMKIAYESGSGGGRSGAITYGVNPYSRNEHSALAAGIARAQSNAGADAPAPKGLSAKALRPGDAASLSVRAPAVSTTRDHSDRSLREADL